METDSLEQETSENINAKYTPLLDEGKDLKQKILLHEDLIITLNGYQEIPIRKFIYQVLCVFSFGIIFLIFHWFPKLKLKLLGKDIPIEDASELYIENTWSSNVVLVKIKQNYYHGKISDIFPKFSEISEYTQQYNITPTQIENANLEQNFYLKYFKYQYIRFIFNPITSKYEQITNWKDPKWNSVKNTIKGIESNEVYIQRQKIFGSNVAQIQQKSTLSFLLDEVLHPFYIFQIFSIILWCAEDYYYYAFCIFVMSVFSTYSTLQTSKENLKKISDMSKFTCPVVVVRQDNKQDSPYKHIDSSDLVPGDVIVIAPDELETFPCDAILLKGDCIVNESMLTGESMPINKIPIKDEELKNLDFEKDDIVAKMGNYCFFAGTSIVRVKGDRNAILNNNNNNNYNYNKQNQNQSTITSSQDPSSKNENPEVPRPKKGKRNLKYETKSAYALVIRTGFNTAKGSLVRSMLFPRQNYFKFYQDSFNFIFVLFIIALIGFCGSLYNFIKYGVPVYVIIIRALDLITIVVPPALPATMSIGTSFAISKLKELNIFCISPNHVIIGGKLNLICFDKTGTLTENGLCVHGVNYMEQVKSSTQDTFALSSSSNNISNLNDSGIKVKFSKLSNHKSKNQEFFSPSYSTVIMDSPLTNNQFNLIGNNDYKNKKGKNKAIFAFEELNNSNEEIIINNNPENTNDIHKSSSQLSLLEKGLNKSYSNHSLSSVFSNSIESFSEDEKSLLISKRYIDLLRFAMATCHNLKVINGKLIGDPLDIEMFKFIDWSIQENESSIDGLTTIVRPKNNFNIERRLDEIDSINSRSIEINENPKIASSKHLFELGILRVFEFASHLRRMSVVVRRMYSQKSNLTVSDSLEVFVKGAPEMIRDLCKKRTIPMNFNLKLHKLVNKGFRVIAVGYKTIENVKFHKLMKMKREEIECDLEFLGFIIFENPLKPGTKNTIEALNEANIRSLMCTGDNILTGISVAKECNMLSKDAQVKILKFVEGTGEVDEHTIPELIHGGRTKEAQLYLENHEFNADEDSDSIVDSDSENSLNDEKEILLNVPSDSDIIYSSNNILNEESLINIHNEYYAMSGDVFDWILHNYTDKQLKSILENCKIFARMLPDQKQILVEKLQEIGYCVSFCGDGANDCGALKSADVGLSLSEAEASVAAPFTSQDMDLKCVLNVIKEGRAALVTNFSCFKYMALYSLIQFTTVSLLYSLAGNLGDAQFLFIDLFLILPVAVAMGRSGSYHKIYHKAPTSNLVSFKVLVSLIGQIIIQILFQFHIFFWGRRQSWYETPEQKGDGKTILSYENTLLFYVSCFQYIVGALVFSVGPPYRQPITTNLMFMSISIFTSLLIISMLFIPEPSIYGFMELMVIPFSARCYTLFIIIVNAIVSILAELHLWRWLTNQFKKKRNLN
jgi:cation-transporting ATPase 13A3/4/5